MNAIRQPAVAGQFYPGSASALSAAVSGYLDAADAGDACVPKAIIAPHAGYVYSGPIAATAYKRLAPAHASIMRVILLGPCHRVAVRGLALSGADYFATPLGQIPVDKEAAKLLADMPQVAVFDETHKLEHSLEVHLPFLQTVLDDFTLVPLVVGEATPESVAAVLEKLWGGDETLIVISSDLSHYLDYESARKIDGATCAAIEELAPEKIARQGACGRFPVGGLLTLAKQRGMSVETVDLRNSGDTAGPRDRVVGYGSWLFFDAGAYKNDTADAKTPAKVVWGKKVASKEAPKVTLKVQPTVKVAPEPAAIPAVVGETDFSAETRALLDRHGLTLILLAATSINHGLVHGKPVPVGIDEHAAELRQPGACFVTLKKQGQLRGCIGSPQAHRALVLDVADNAFKAAFKDPRFSPLAPGERDGLDLSIAVLSPQTAMTFADEADLLQQLRPGRDGVVIADGTRRALFLPSVWEQLPDPRAFLQQLKRKAGMTPGHWSAGFQAQRFVTESVAIGDYTEA
jgi:AmmeMemoRadiSam system protein B/AmmeMemoRadiSam system protein A